MITMEQCKIFSGLLSYEMVVGPAPSPKHRARLTGYLLNLKWGQATVREMIVADIRVALDLGALNRAADLLVVLRLFLSDHPEARKRQDRDVYKRQEEFLRQFRVLYPNEAILRNALRGCAAYQLNWFDAHLWSYAEHYGLEEILTEDLQHDRLYGTVRVVNPFVGLR